MSNERPTGNEVNVLQDSRLYVQPGGARPNSPARYYGQNANYGIIQALVAPINGEVTPVYTGDPRVLGKYRLVRRTIGVPPLPSATFNFLEKRGTLNRLLAQDCGGTFYNLVGDCADPSSILYGWQGGKLEVYGGAIFTSMNGGNRSDWANDTPIINSIPATLREFYEVGAIGFGSILASEIAVQVNDVVFGNVQRCAGCGQPNDGTNWQYGIQTFTGSNEGNVLYRITDSQGTTIAEGSVDITGIGVSAVPTAIDVAGQYLIVLVTSENAYYFAAINQATGIPGAFTKVTTGFVATKTPTDLLVYNEHEIYMSANGGYVYKLTNVGQAVTVLTAGGATTSNLARINGRGDVIAAAGALGVGIVSQNRGQSWSVIPTVPEASNVLALEVLDGQRYFFGNAAGGFWYTLDGGNTWSEIVLSDSPTAINDIVAVNDEQIWVAGTNTTDALLWWSPDGGADWTTANAGPRMDGIPTDAQSILRLAVPSAANTQIAANTLLMGGLGLSTDGFMAFGTANFF